MTKHSNNSGVDWLNLSEASIHLQISRPTIYKLLGRNAFPEPMQVGRMKLFCRDTLDTWQANRKKAKA